MLGISVVHKKHMSRTPAAEVDRTSFDLDASDTVRCEKEVVTQAKKIKRKKDTSPDSASSGLIPTWHYCVPIME